MKEYEKVGKRLILYQQLLSPSVQLSPDLLQQLLGCQGGFAPLGYPRAPLGEKFQIAAETGVGSGRGDGSSGGGRLLGSLEQILVVRAVMGALAVPVALCVSVGTLHALPKKPRICPTRASGALSNDSGGFLGSGETLRRSREVQGRLRNSGIAPAFLIEWLLIEWPLPIPP